MTTCTIRRDLRVSTRDGVSLATDVWLPDGDGPFPTLLQRTPYGREVAYGTQTISGMENLRALDAGFALVIQDTRGRFGSGGDFDPFVHEAQDGADTVEWIRRQDFSDGQVATYGASYVGATQLLLAMTGSEGHLAMAPFLTTGDYHHTWTHRDGALQLGFLWLWVVEGLGPTDVDRRALVADHPARTWLARASAAPDEVLHETPVLNDGLLAVAPYLADWADRPVGDDFWRAVDPLRQVDQVTASGLHVVGLNDIFAEGSVLAYRTLRERGSTARVRDGQYLVLGPWSHGNLGEWQGDHWLGYGASTASIDLVGMQLDFFAAVMAGREPDLPRVRYFVTGADEWRTASEWPPPASERWLHLAPGGALLDEAPETEGAQSYPSDPADPVPTVGGQTFLLGVQMGRNSGPKDQAEVEARSDVLVHRSQPLVGPVTVAGSVALELWAASSAEDCDWTARLVDVHPDGRSYGVADGILRSRSRGPLVPGRPELFRVEIGTVAHRFGTGHRIGVQVASSNFPRFDRNPQCLVDPGRATVDDFVVAEQTVFHGGAMPSRLLLPVIEES